MRVQPEDGSLEERIRADALALATDEIGVDEHDVIEGFRWVGYPGTQGGLRVHVFPRPIDARAFFLDVDGSIRDLLAQRPTRGVRSGPSIPGYARSARTDAAYLSPRVLESIVRSAESRARAERTGVSHVFSDPPRSTDLISYSFSPDEVDAYRPSRSGPTLTSAVERFVAIDRFGTAPPGDVDIIARPDIALQLEESGDRLTDHRGAPLNVRISSSGSRPYLLSFTREGALREYRLLPVRRSRDGIVWYVDAHDVLGAIRTYAPSLRTP